MSTVGQKEYSSEDLSAMKEIEEAQTDAAAQAVVADLKMQPGNQDMTIDEFLTAKPSNWTEAEAREFFTEHSKHDGDATTLSLEDRLVAMDPNFAEILELDGE